MEEGLTKVYDILSNIEERTKNHSKLLEDVPDIKTTLKKLVDTQDSLAQSNNRIAATFEVLTETQKMLQSQNKDLQATVLIFQGRDQFHSLLTFQRPRLVAISALGIGK